MFFSHPLYPFLTVIFERCELATSTARDFNKEAQQPRESAADAFKDDLMTFIETRKHDKTYYAPNPELDKLMLNAIQVLRLHLLELEKVSQTIFRLFLPFQASGHGNITTTLPGGGRRGEGGLVNWPPLI